MTKFPTPLTSTLNTSAPASRRQVLGWGGGLAVAWVGGTLGGCGGGAGVGGTGDTVGAFSSGSISGFGSVIVNGVRFDDSTARVEDEFGSRRDRSELRLGMTTEIDSDTIRSDATGLLATARSIRFSSELLGPVSLVDPVAGSLVVLGQAVRVSVATVVDSRLVGGLAGVTVGSLVEVYGFFDGSGFVATRLEPVTGLVGSYKLRGVISALNTTGQSFRVGAQSFSYAGVTSVPAQLANGSYVRLQLRTTLGAGAWVVTSFADGVRALADLPLAKLEGRITSFTSASAFNVNGQAVDASGLNPKGLALGVRVEVEGPVMAGVLRAQKLQLETDDEVQASGIELHGAIEQITPAQRRFVLRGSVVSYASTGIRFENGSAADLAVGRRVELRGTLSADRTVVEATRISFE